MQIDKFFAGLSSQFENWGRATLAPKNSGLKEIANSIQQRNTVNFYQLVVEACRLLGPGEAFCEIGCLAGGNLVAALRDNPEVLAYGIDFYSPDEDETNRRIEILQGNLEKFGVLERVSFAHTSIDEFFQDLREIVTPDKFGVYVYNFVPDYRQVLMSLLWSRPYLANQAVVIINNSQVSSVQQAINDFLAMEPAAKVLLDWQMENSEIFGGQGLAILAWDQDNQLGDFEPFLVEAESTVDKVGELWAQSTKKKVLHVGCGPYNPNALPPELRTDDWQEIRLDINPAVNPDILGTITDLSAVPDSSMEALYSSHNIEHIHTHEVPSALQEFKRVLKTGGKAIITCPDIQAVAMEVAIGRLQEILYVSPAGPIAAIDIMYGLGTDLAKGNYYMAHKTAFTAETLKQKLVEIGFTKVEISQGGLNLWAVAWK